MRESYASTPLGSAVRRQADYRLGQAERIAGSYFDNMDRSAQGRRDLQAVDRERFGSAERSRAWGTAMNRRYSYSVYAQGAAGNSNG